MNPPTDCLRCGAGCFSESGMFVRVTGEDWAKLDADAARVAGFIGHRAALELRPATTDGGNEFFCTIYDRRPQICRDLARDSPECDGERALKG